MTRFFQAKFLFFTIVIVVIVGISYIYRQQLQSPTTNNKLKIAKVIRKDLVQKVTAVGEISANRTTVILAPYPGHIQKIFVEVGDHVDIQSPLVILVPSNQTAQTTAYPIRSPVSGTVVQSQKEGDSLSKQGDSLLRIDDLSKLFVDASVPEIDYIKIKKKQEVLIRPTALNNILYKGKIIDLSLASIRDENRWNNSALNAKYFIRVEILDPDENLHPGMSATLDIITNKKEKALILPHEYLISEENKNFVTLNKNQEKREIKIGLRDMEGFEILEGVNEGDEVLQVDFSLYGENE